MLNLIIYVNLTQTADLYVNNTGISLLVFNTLVWVGYLQKHNKILAFLEFDLTWAFFLRLVVFCESVYLKSSLKDCWSQKDAALVVKKEMRSPKCYTDKHYQRLAEEKDLLRYGNDEMRTSGKEYFHSK